MLEGDGCHPDVVLGNWASTGTQSLLDLAVSARCFSVTRENHVVDREIIDSGQVVLHAS